MKSDFYRNPWIPAEARARLAAETGTILDVGGGAAPYWRADHILDIQPYDEERLNRNAWGREERAFVRSCVRGEGEEGRDFNHGGTEGGAGGEGAFVRSCVRGEGEEGRDFNHGGTEEGEGGEGAFVRSCVRPFVEEGNGEGPRTMDQGPRTMDQGPRTMDFPKDEYTQWDVCDGRRWPFPDNAFDLGLCSHTLEDLADPLPVVRELSRVCRRVLIVTPSRLLEQMRGIDHYGYCGFRHHRWMVFEEDGRLVFQRKTPLLNRPEAHLRCPLGRTLRIEFGCVAFESDRFEPVEKTFADENAERADLAAFAAAWRGRRDLFGFDPRAKSWRYWVYRLRQL